MVNEGLQEFTGDVGPRNHLLSVMMAILWTWLALLVMGVPSHDNPSVLCLVTLKILLIREA